MAFLADHPMTREVVDVWLNRSFVSTFGCGLVPHYFPCHGHVYFTGVIGRNIVQPLDVVGLYRYDDMIYLDNHTLLIKAAQRKDPWCDQLDRPHDLVLSEFKLSTYIEFYNFEENQVIVPRQYVQIDMIPELWQEYCQDNK